MAKLSNYWRFITPATRNQIYTTVQTDSYDPRGTTSSVSWYTQILQGPGSRNGLYKQYDAMDTDIDIARSLDIIAEEMTNEDSKTDLPFEIKYQKEDNEDISDTTVVTLRQAVREWSNTQDFRRRLFRIARTMVKYGDCFFRKLSDTKKWVYVDPYLVKGIEVDQWNNVVAYHVKKPATGGNIWARQEETEVIPAVAMIHFTMSDDMGDMVPFGPSVLRPVIRVYKQLSMMEDATIIYRIVRAPERRVFYIDVGNVPPQRVKIYLEQIKNEIRQKRSPGVSNNGKDNVDGTYDIQSIQEDMFFPVTAAGKGARVETLPGGSEDFGSNLLKYFTDKIFRGLRIPTSYMQGPDGTQSTAQTNDGKVGIAYIEELRFANYVMRLQRRMEDILDNEFKIYLKVVGLKIDDEVFRIKLPDPANFALYRQAALDADLISSFSNISGTDYLSKRFVLKRYLGLTDDEIQMNEVMIKEERNISETSAVSDLQQIYDPKVYENRETITIEHDTPSSVGIDSGEEDNGIFGSPSPEENFEEPEPEEPAEAPEPTTPTTEPEPQ